MTAPKKTAEDITALISTIIAYGKTGNLRSVVQTLGEIEKITRAAKDEPKLQEALAEAYRHTVDPMGVAKKFKDVEQLLNKIEDLLKMAPRSEPLQETLSEAYTAAIFHYIKDSNNRAIHKNMKKLGELSTNNQTNPFVQFNYAAVPSQVAEFFVKTRDEEVLLSLLWEIVGIVDFFPGREILSHVVPGLHDCISSIGHCLKLSELEGLAKKIDEFINFTSDFDIQQQLTACQGKIFQYIAGQRMREGLNPDGTMPHRKK